MDASPSGARVLTKEENKMPPVVTRILSPTDWKERQINTLKQVGEANYAVGITKPRKDPIAAGIAAEGKFNNAMKKALDSRARAHGLEGTTMQEWGAYTENIGRGRLVEGVTKREAKITGFLQTYQPLLADHVGKLDALPVDTDGDREQKVLANLRGLKALHGKA